MSLYLNILDMFSLGTETIIIYRFNFFSVVQESACPVGDEEEAGGGSFAVHPEGRDADCGPGSGQTGLGQGFQ